MFYWVSMLLRLQAWYISEAGGTFEGNERGIDFFSIIVRQTKNVLFLIQEILRMPCQL